jgi:hypothetical protein
MPDIYSLEDEEQRQYSNMTKSSDTNPRVPRSRGHEFKWQQKYVNSHVNCGHSGFCYAWLDNAFCPQMYLLGKCSVGRHSYPESWSEVKKAEHTLQIRYMEALYSDETGAENDTPSQTNSMSTQDVQGAELMRKLEMVGYSNRAASLVCQQRQRVIPQAS